MNVPENLFYTKEHEWVRLEGKTAYMGISDYAQSSLGDITFVELPEKGAVLKQFQQCATVESVKAASEVYTPLPGTVTAVNQELSAHPELVNQSPYEKGYLFVLEIAAGDEKSNLMDAAGYAEYLKGLGE